jgi:hypothetical protein
MAELSADCAELGHKVKLVQRKRHWIKPPAKSKGEIFTQGFFYNFEVRHPDIGSIGEEFIKEPLTEIFIPVDYNDCTGIDSNSGLQYFVSIYVRKSNN